VVIVSGSGSLAAAQKMDQEPHTPLVSPAFFFMSLAGTELVSGADERSKVLGAYGLRDHNGDHKALPAPKMVANTGTFTTGKWLCTSR